MFKYLESVTIKKLLSFQVGFIKAIKKDFGYVFFGIFVI